MPRIIETSKEEYREEARKRIICAAITIMKRRGYRALTVEEVAKEVGVTKGTLYLYFENKEDLLNHVFRESVRVFEVIIRDSADVISGDNDLNTVLEHIITHSLGLQKIYGSMNDNIAFVTEFVSHAIRDPDIYTKFQQAFVDYIQVFEDWLRLLEKEELIRDGMDIRGTAFGIIGLMGAVKIRIFFGDNEDEVKRWWISMVKNLLGVREENKDVERKIPPCEENRS